MTERWGSRFSAGLGTLLLSALVAVLQGWERAWEGGCAGVSEALLPARCPVHPSPGARALALPSPAFPKSRRGQRRPAARPRAAPGAERNEWRLDRRTEVAAAAAGSRPAHPGGPGSKFSAGCQARKVRCDKFRSGQRSCSCLGAEDREGSGTGWCRTPGPEISCPKSLTRYSLTCDSGSRSGGFADFSAFRTWRPAVGEAKVRSQLCRQLREWLYGLVART